MAHALFTGGRLSQSSHSQIGQGTPSPQVQQQEQSQWQLHGHTALLGQQLVQSHQQELGWLCSCMWSDDAPRCTMRRSYTMCAARFDHYCRR
jgi:hypothetical protein